jgi:hypothetical protein
MTFQKGRALCIGISQYAGRNVLPSAVANDASDIAALLRDPAFCSYPPAQVHVLLNKQATKSAILTELAWLAREAAPDETVFVFFSGHGARSAITGQGHLVPVDVNATNIDGTCISGVELSQALSAIKADRVVTLLDACHSGGTGDPKSSEVTSFPLGLADKDYDTLAEGAGRVLMASSRATEVSYCQSGMRNSVFTTALLQALRGAAAIRNDGHVRVFDVFHYVSQEVAARQPNQHPIFKGTAIEQNFPLALYRGGKDVSAPTTYPSDDSWWYQLEALVCELYPSGPADSEFWSRAGGDPSQLRPSQTGRATWHNAMRTLRQGGGGAGISAEKALGVVLIDYPSSVQAITLRLQLVAAVS